MNKHLETVDEVIEALDGPRVVAELTKHRGNGASRVPMWKHRRQFPAATYTVLQEALQKKGLTAPAKLWGML